VRRTDDRSRIGDLYVFVLAGFPGYQVISRVSPPLHTPRVGHGAISGIAGRLPGNGCNQVSTILGSSR
jgi:hypothetical protein